MSRQTDDEKTVRALVDAFVQGWNARDGDGCGRPFAENADFTAVTGLRARGRDLIARGHTEILSTVFRHTRLAATVNDVSFLRPDVAVADVTFRMTSEVQVPSIPKYSSCGVVAAKDNGEGSIAVFRNMVPFDRPMSGQFESGLLRATQAVAALDA